MAFSNRKLIHTATAGLVAGMLTLPGTPVQAASPPSPGPAEVEEPAEPEVSARSREAFEQGLDAYEGGDYAGAARHWTEAHDLIAETPELSASRHVLGFDLAQAQMRAYAEDGDERRVDAARPLLERYIAWVDRPGHTMDEGEKQDRQRAVELLEQSEPETAPPAPVPPPVPSAPAPSPPPPPAEPKPNGTGLLIGGGVALGAGIGSIVGAFASVAAGRKAEDAYNLAAVAADHDAMDAAARDGRRANIGVLVSATSAALLTAAGVTMLAIGGRRRHRYVSASAALTPSSAGASVSMRF